MSPTLPSSSLNTTTGLAKPLDITTASRLSSKTATRLVVVATGRQPRPSAHSTARPPLERRPNGPKCTRRGCPPLTSAKPSPLAVTSVHRRGALPPEARSHGPSPGPGLDPRPSGPTERRRPALRSRGPGRTDGLALPLQLRLLLAPPNRQAVEEAQRRLRGAVERHLVLELAALLREGARPLVHPLVAVHLAALGRRGRRRLDDGVDAVLVGDVLAWAVGVGGG